MTHIPDGLPSLAAGTHDSHEGVGCVMEYVSLLAGEAWSDHPACTHPVLAAAARNVNDRLADEARHLLVPLIPRLFGTSAGADGKHLCVQLALFAAESVAHLDPSPEGARARQVTRLWLDGMATTEDVRRAATDAYAAYHAAYYAAAAAARAAATTARVAYVYYAAATAAHAAHYAASGVGFLSDLIDEYDRLTGRNKPAPLPVETLRELATTVTARKA